MKTNVFYDLSSASLVQQTVQSAYRTIEDFEFCRIADEDICFVKGDGIETFWENSMSNRYVSSIRQNLDLFTLFSACYLGSVSMV